MGEVKMKNYDYLAHHGILGQKWGVRNGPPYPLGGGDFSPSEEKKIRAKRKTPNSRYNKKHYDEVLRAGKTKLRTLSYDPDRLKGTDMYYAAHKTMDKHQYNVLFNKKIPQTIYDKNGNAIGTGSYLKFKIDSNVTKDIKVASEDSGARIFSELFKKDRDFSNYVTDASRMQDYFVKDKYKFKGYREARRAIEKMRADPSNITSNDLKKAYRIFNYVIPYDGAGDERKGKDALNQRTKFFKACKDAGYGAVLDTNDAIYGGFKARSPVIIFDLENVVQTSVKRTSTASKHFSECALTGRRILGNLL